MRTARAAILAALASAAFACGSSFESADVALGSALAKEEGTTCRGRGCEPVTMRALALDESNPRRCPLRPGAALEVVWSHPLYADLESGEPMIQADCGALSPCVWDGSAVKLAGADDGTLWITATVVPAGDQNLFEKPVAGVWLARYAADGALVSGELVDHERLQTGDLLRYDVSLTSGGQGGALLGVHKELATEGFAEAELQRWVRRYGSNGVRAGPVVKLDPDNDGWDAPKIAPVGETSMAVLDGRKLMLLNDSHAEWEREVGPYPDRVVTDGGARLWTFSPSVPGSSGTELHQFLADGTPSWIRRFERMTQDVRLATDASGAVVRSAIPIDDPQQTRFDRDSMLLHKISASGESEWCLELKPDPIDGTEMYQSTMGLVVDTAGTSWLIGPGYFVPPPPDAIDAEGSGGARLYEIAADGEHCVVHDMPDAAGFSAIAPGPDGGLYYFNSNEFGLLR